MPCDNVVIVVAAEDAEVIVPDDGPEIFTQLYADILPSASVPLPFSETVLTGNVIV